MTGPTRGGNNSGNTSFYNGDAATNTIYTQAIKNNRLFYFFTNETKKNIPYIEFTINRLYLLGYVKGIISLYNFAVLDENDDYIIKLYPAKKGNDVGLFDAISNTFYAATNQANYELINQII